MNPATRSGELVRYRAWKSAVSVYSQKQPVLNVGEVESEGVVKSGR